MAKSSARFDPKRELQELVDAQLPSRVVFSLLKPAVRVASRLGLPMQRFVELARLAYFAERRAEEPDSLESVADALGLSTRHAGTLNRLLKQDFFRPEREVAPLRRITSLLLSGSLTEREIERGVSDLDPTAVEQALGRLVELGWVSRTRNRYELAGQLRSLVDDSLVSRMDALNHQLEVITRAVWSKFIAQRPDAAIARTWTFATHAEAFRRFAERTIREIRNTALDLEEEARSTKEGAEEFAVTVVFTDLKEEPRV